MPGVNGVMNCSQCSGLQRICSNSGRLGQRSLAGSHCGALLFVPSGPRAQRFVTALQQTHHTASGKSGSKRTIYQCSPSARYVLAAVSATISASVTQADSGPAAPTTSSENGRSQHHRGDSNETSSGVSPQASPPLPEDVPGQDVSSSSGDGIPQQSDAPTPKVTFADLGVDPRIAGKLREQGILEATPVQLAAIPRILDGTNVAVQCYTGSGKTLAYLLPVLTDAIARAEAEGKAAADGNGKGRFGTLQAVVVAPSRELAMQIVRVAHSLLPAGSRGAVQQCIGGANPHRQAEAVHVNRPVMVVGTPGRLAEFSRSGVLATHFTGTLVLDEADQLLESHFREDLGRLLEHTGRRCLDGRQTVLVSATLTPAVLSACSAWCPDLVPVSVSAALPQVPSPAAQRETSEVESTGRPGAAATARAGMADAAPAHNHWGWEATTPVQSKSAAAVGRSSDAGRALPPNIDHTFVVTEERHKVDTLRRCIYAADAQRLLVFMNFQQRLKDTAHKLAAGGMSVGCLHGELGKLERQTILNRFRSGKLRALVVSDVAARGLDVAECDAVFNLELPSDAAAYAHRAGRTARMGRQGTMVSLVSPSEAFVVPKLGRQLGITIPRAEVSEGRIQLLNTPDITTTTTNAETGNSTSNSSTTTTNGIGSKPNSATTDYSTGGGSRGGSGSGRLGDSAL